MRHVIEPGKLSGYLLNPAHPDGGPKARFFFARGFVRHRPEDPAVSLKRHPLAAVEVKRVWTKDGDKLVFQCAFAAADGTRPCITSVWVEDLAVGERRLITAYPATPLRIAS